MVTVPAGIMPQLISDSPNAASSAARARSQAISEFKGAAEAPAVDHGDRRFAVELQPLPLRRGAFSHDLHALVVAEPVGGAEIFAQVHPRRIGIASASQHHDAAAFVRLERLEHVEHLERHRRIDGVALLRAVHRYPGDAVDDLDKDGRATGECGGLCA